MSTLDRPFGMSGPFVRLALAAILLIAAVRFTYFFDPTVGREGPYAFAIRVTTSKGGYAQVFVDRGDGFRQQTSSSHAVSGSGSPERLVLPIGGGAIRQIRFDYLNGPPAEAILEQGAIIDTRDGSPVRTFHVSEFTPNEHILAYRVTGDIARVVPRADADDAQLTLAFDPVLQLGPSAIERFVAELPGLLTGVAALFVLGLAGRWFVCGRDGSGLERVRRSWSRFPRAWLTGVAFVAVITCCHPIIFAGRSLVSADFGLPLLHPEHEPPGQRRSERADVRGSDTGAMLWQHLPYSVIQHEALIEQRTLPLWNRYNSCGVALLGQGQSMFGDPLHVPVVLAGGAAWAWDAKFVVARFLFAWGIGLAAFAATRQWGASALVTAAAPFIGYFSYRVNHPAIVSLCYSPWILVAWFEIARSPAERRTWRWLVLLTLANWCVLTSGTVKEAGMLAVGLNLTGLAVFGASDHPWRSKRRVLAATVALAIGGLLVTAPLWLAFKHALSSSWTAYDAAYAVRLTALRFIGYFDELFYSQYFPDRRVYAPSTNALFLAGLAGLLARWRAAYRDPFVVVPAIGLCLALSCAFEVGWLPSTWLLAIPGVRSIGHVGNTFSCVAIPLTCVLAAKGFTRWSTERRQGDTARQAGLGVLIIICGLAVFLWDVWPFWREASGTRSAWTIVRDQIPFFVYGFLLLSGLVGLLVAMHWLRSANHAVSGFLLILAAFVALLARHGQLVSGGVPGFFLHPGERSDLAAPSPALEWAKHRETEPFRLVGVDAHVFSGYTAVHGIEGPNGPDALANRHYRELTSGVGLSPERDWTFPTTTEALTPRRRFLDMVNVRYYATCENAGPPPPWTHPVAAMDLTLHASPTAWPRAFFTDAVEHYDTCADFLARLEAGDGQPFAAMQHESARAPATSAAAPSTRTIVPARDYELRTNQTAFTVDTPGPGWVVLMETWMPDAFRARVNERDAEVVQMNHAFKAVRIESAGTHRVSFTFRPDWLDAAPWLSLAGVLVIAGTLIRTRAGRVPGTLD